jgi:hypothetical protein
VIGSSYQNKQEQKKKSKCHQSRLIPSSDVSDAPVSHHPISIIADQTPSLDGPYVFQTLKKPQCKMMKGKRKMKKKITPSSQKSDPTKTAFKKRVRKIIGSNKSISPSRHIE